MSTPFEDHNPDAPTPDAADASATDVIPVVAPRRDRRSAGVAAIRAVSGLTVLAVVIAATWYADVGRTQVAVTVPVAADRQAAVVAPAVPGAGGPAVAGPTTPAPPAAPAAPAANAPAAAVAISPGSGTTLPGGAGTTPSTPITPGAPGAVPGTQPGGSVAINGTGGGGAAAGFATAPVAEQPPCPGIPKPDKSGGLQSIVSLAPMFGSFSSEVFALGPALQPALQLFGPILAELEPVITKNLPWITPILNQISAGTAVVLKAILPFYGPYREQFIAAEGQFAASIAPILTRVYQTPAAACLVALEGQIIRNAKGKPIHTPSLSRPGQTNVFRPRS